jgi:N6-adenosine-specific RNA methylase IME4
VRERIVELMGNLPRLEMFARVRTPGWDVWGNEVKGAIDISSLQTTTVDNDSKKGWRECSTAS